MEHIEEPKIPRATRKGKKMGRPPILKPYIMALIKRRISWERRRPAEDRLPVKTLAAEFQKELRENPQVKRVPKLSTLERAFSKCLRDWNQLDDAWSIFTLRDKEREIPPETLPIVLSFWASTLHNRDVQITIREAQWAARLSSLAGCMHPEFFGILVDVYATADMLAELPGGAEDLGQLHDLMAWTCLAKADIDRSDKAEADRAALEKTLEEAVDQLQEKIRLPQAVYTTGTPGEIADLRKGYEDLGQEFPWEHLGKVQDYLGRKAKGGKKR